MRARRILQFHACVALVLVLSLASAQDCDSDCDCPNRAPKLLNADDLPIEIDQATLQRQYDALSNMSLERVEYSPSGPIEALEGDTGIVLPRDFPERNDCEPADDLLALVGTILLANGTESLTVGREKSAFANRRARLLLQTIRGKPVIQGLVGIEYDKSTLAVTRVVANFVPDRGLPQVAMLTAQQAEQRLPEGWTPGPHIDPESNEAPQGAHLAYYSAARHQSAGLVWAIPVSVGGMPEWAYVNAVTGLVAGRVPGHVHENVAIISEFCDFRR